MSNNQSQSDKSETQRSRPGRGWNSSQRRSFTGGGVGVGAPPPLSTPISSTPSLPNNRSYMISGSGPGGQSRVGHASLNSQSNSTVSNARILRNDADDESISVVAEPNALSVTRAVRSLPQAPPSQPTSEAADSPFPATPSKGIVLQFGSLSPGFMNGVQMPARTSSAPPNLDEQKLDQILQNSFKALPTSLATFTQKTQQLKDVGSIKQPNIVEFHPSSQAKWDAQLQFPPAFVATNAQRLAAIPTTGISMAMPYQQAHISLQFGAPATQMHSQGVVASSLQMPLPLPVGNTAQRRAQVFVPGLQNHQWQPLGMIHQGQSIGFAPQIGHQLQNLGFSIAPQFAAQQPAKHASSRRTVKITHPETHEELRLMPESYLDSGSSGPRSHPNVPLHSQSIQSAHAHSVNYISTVQANPYNRPLFLPNQTPVPPVTQINPGSSAVRFNYPVVREVSPLYSINPFAINPSPSGMAGSVRVVTEPSNTEHALDRAVGSISARTSSVRVTVKPAAKPLPEKVVTSETGSLPIRKVESPKSLRQPTEPSVLNLETDNSSDAYLKEPQSVSESSDLLNVPASIKHSAHTSVSMLELPSGTWSIPSTAAVFTNSDSQRKDDFGRSNSWKDQHMRQSKKEIQISQQQHQVENLDSFGKLSSSLLKLPDDGISDLNGIQESKTPKNVHSSEVRFEGSLLAPNFRCCVSSSPEIVSEVVTSLECSGISFEGVKKISGDVHATFCDSSIKHGVGLLDGEMNVSKSVDLSGLDRRFDPEKVENFLPKENNGFVSSDVILEFESADLEQVSATVYNTSSLDCSTSGEYSGSIIPERTGEKTGEEFLQPEAFPVSAGKIAAAESKKLEVNVAEYLDFHVPDNITSFIPFPKIESERSTHGQGSTLISYDALIQETVVTASSALPEATLKREGKGAENTGEGRASSLVSKDNIHVEQSRGKILPGKNKTQREILVKADAAGLASDLYMAYKDPEENHEILIISESADSSAHDQNHACAETDLVDDGLSKSELDDREYARGMPMPKLKPSGNSNLVHGVSKKDDEYDKVAGKKYTRDFLLTFANQCNDLPTVFEIASDILDSLMTSRVASSHRIDHDSYKGPGKIIDRPSPGSHNDHCGSGVTDVDKWSKATGSFASGRDPFLHVTHGAVGANFCPGQVGNNAPVKNLRGQSFGQYIGGILSGPNMLTSPGGMARINGDAGWWQNAKGLIPAPTTPLQVMHKAESKYEIGKISDEEEAKQRKLKAILNKLTPQNFDKLFDQVKGVNIDSALTLSSVISQIFDKALMEPTFCEMYANFCYHLASALPDFNEDNEKITFKRLLLNKCQEEFEKGEREQAEANEAEVAEIKQSKGEVEEKKVKARRRMLGNIRLIGELYNKKMLTDRIMHECINKLLGQYENPDEEHIEALCKLMSTIGEMIDRSKAKEHMDVYFDMMLKLSYNQKLSSRLRFMLKDAIDLRKNKWQQRRKVDGPKKIEEVHRDAAQEKQLQTSRVSRGASGISSSRRGTPIDYGPRLPTSLSSSNSYQMNASRGLTPPLRGGHGSQDVRWECRNFQETRMPSVPFLQRPIDDGSITLGPQVGLARGMSIRGQSLVPSSSVVDVPPSHDHRRMTLSSNGYNFASDWAPYNSREDQRRMSERPVTRSSNEHSSSVQYNKSFRNKGNLDCTFDSAMPALSAADCVQGSISGPHSAPESDDHLRNKSILAIREYYCARNEDEIRLCIRELNSPSFYPEMVMLWVMDSFERKNDSDRELLAKLLVNLSKSQDHLLSQIQLMKGFETVLSMLEDAITDSPKAAEYLGRILGKIISENVVSLMEVGRIIKVGGDGQGRLLETGLAADVLVSIFEFIQQDRGGKGLAELWMSSNLRLEDFRHPDLAKSKRLEAFI